MFLKFIANGFLSGTNINNNVGTCLIAGER